MPDTYLRTATKAQLLDMIFEELGRAGYEFDRTPDEEISALRKVDALMGEWQAAGCYLGYNFPLSFGNSLPTDPVGIPDAAMNAVAAWGAFRHAPGIGKTMSAESRKAMADGKSLWFAQTACIPSMRIPPGTAIGSGHNPFAIWRPFVSCYCPEQVPAPVGSLATEDGNAIITEDGQLLS